MPSSHIKRWHRIHVSWPLNLITPPNRLRISVNCFSNVVCQKYVYLYNIHFVYWYFVQYYAIWRTIIPSFPYAHVHAHLHHYVHHHLHHHVRHLLHHCVHDHLHHYVHDHLHHYAPLHFHHGHPHASTEPLICLRILLVHGDVRPLIFHQTTKMTYK